MFKLREMVVSLVTGRHAGHVGRVTGMFAGPALDKEDGDTYRVNFGYDEEALFNEDELLSFFDFGEGIE